MHLMFAFCFILGVSLQRLTEFQFFIPVKKSASTKMHDYDIDCVHKHVHVCWNAEGY